MREQWQLYINREPIGWQPCGAFGSRRLGEQQLVTMRQLLPDRHFRLVWEGQQDVAA